MSIYKLTEKVLVNDTDNSLINNGSVDYGNKTQAEINALTGVTKGSKVFNTTTDNLQVYITSWVNISAGTGNNIYNADGILTNIRTVDINDKELYFQTTNNGFLGIYIQDAGNGTNMDIESSSYSIGNSFVNGFTVINNIGQNVGNITTSTGVNYGTSQYTIQTQNTVSGENNLFYLSSDTNAGAYYRDNNIIKKGIRYINFGEYDVNDSTNTANFSTLTWNSLVPKKYVDDSIISNFLLPNFITVRSLSDLPAPSSNVIFISSKTTLFFPSEVDLIDNSLNFGADCAIIGSSSETSKITSSLANGVPLIYSYGSLSIQNISLQAIPASIGDVPIIFKLDGITELNAALDWNFVNIIDSNGGIINNYANAIFLNCAFIGSTNGLTFDGNFDSIVFDGCIFRNGISGSCITITPTATINRRLRIENTPFVVLPGSIGIDVSPLANINTEGYIAKFVNFSGGGTYLQGVQPNDNKALFLECRGVPNSASITEYYMINNTTATTISATNTYTKIAGVTSNGAYIQRFTNTNNRSTYEGALTKFFKVDVVASLSSGNNHLIGVRIAKNGITIPSSESQMTTSALGRSENIKSQTIVSLSTSDYIEVFVCNQTNVTNISVSELNTIITPLN